MSKRRAIVKVYDLSLSFDTALSDNQIKEYSTQLIKEINKIIATKFTKDLPQLDFIKGKEHSFRIGITLAPEEDDD